MADFFIGNCYIERSSPVLFVIEVIVIMFFQSQIVLSFSVSSGKFFLKCLIELTIPCSAAYFAMTAF